jgi:hypothetical protein
MPSTMPSAWPRPREVDFQAMVEHRGVSVTSPERTRPRSSCTGPRGAERFSYALDPKDKMQ